MRVLSIGDQVTVQVDGRQVTGKLVGKTLKTITLSLGRGRRRVTVRKTAIVAVMRPDAATVSLKH